mmetsp:Transcript_37618/g.80278  ORF Transcript_37618/g.80278 Transcript_37618/m.80278 type:complete len:471 (-) Transcript_37618:711-2123(-)
MSIIAAYGNHLHPSPHLVDECTLRSPFGTNVVLFSQPLQLDQRALDIRVNERTRLQVRCERLAEARVPKRLSVPGEVHPLDAVVAVAVLAAQPDAADPGGAKPPALDRCGFGPAGEELVEKEEGEVGDGREVFRVNEGGGPLLGVFQNSSGAVGDDTLELPLLCLPNHSGAGADPVVVAALHPTLPRPQGAREDTPVPLHRQVLRLGSPQEVRHLLAVRRTSGRSPTDGRGCPPLSLFVLQPVRPVNQAHLPCSLDVVRPHQSLRPLRPSTALGQRLVPPLDVLGRVLTRHQVQPAVVPDRLNNVLPPRGVAHGLVRTSGLGDVAAEDAPEPHLAGAGGTGTLPGSVDVLLRRDEYLDAGGAQKTLGLRQEVGVGREGEGFPKSGLIGTVGDFSLSGRDELRTARLRWRGLGIDSRLLFTTFNLFLGRDPPISMWMLDIRYRIVDRRNFRRHPFDRHGWRRTRKFRSRQR